MPKKTPAVATYDALKIDPADYTPAMTLAIKQRWTDLPVDRSVAQLRLDLAAVTAAATPTAAELAALNEQAPSDECEKEAKRLAGNAKVNAWRERGRIRAALDARGIKFAKMRDAAAAKKAAPVEVAPLEPAPLEPAL